MNLDTVFKLVELGFAAGGAYAAIRIGGKVLEQKVAGLEAVITAHVAAINTRISSLEARLNRG